MFDARQRIEALLDPDSFIEYGLLAGATSDVTDTAAADGLIAGCGLVHGRPVVAASYDTSVLAGSQSDRNMRKLNRLIYLAITQRWPFVCFIDGSGTRAQDPPPPPPIMIGPRGRWDLYDGLAELSGWAPTISILCGRATDGNAGIAMLSDFVVATIDSEFAFRDPDHPSEQPWICSAEDYAREGHLDLLVDSAQQAVAAARNYLGYCLIEGSDGLPSPEHDRIADIIPDNRKRPYDMRRVINAFADHDSVLELGAHWGRSMCTVLARLRGRSVGILANQPKSPLAGAIDATAADKAARFIELCDCYGFPIISFIDNPGFMVGPQAEQEGLARHHARPLAALHHRSVPLCSVQIRKAYGLGPYAMSGFGTGRVVPELRLAWPCVESGGMSLEGAAYLVKRKEIQAAASREEALAIRDRYAEQMRESASGLRAGRSFSFDDIVEPQETRALIGRLLDRIPRVLGDRKKHPIDFH